MEILIWIGTAVSIVGVSGLILCIVIVARAKREGLPDDELRARLQSVVALNLAALFVSAIGLMLVILGIVLG